MIASNVTQKNVLALNFVKGTNLPIEDLKFYKKDQQHCLNYQVQNKRALVETTKDSMDVQKKERVEDSLEQEEGEIVEDSFDKIQEQDDNEDEVLSRVVLDFDLNEEADYEFDLNKFPEEEEEENRKESSHHVEFRPVIKKMIKKLLPKFY